MAVAGRDPVKNLCEEATCPVCLEYFKDPVTTECGHNFCQTCLTQCWEESGSAEISCPQCREKVLQSNPRPNRQLANMVEIAKELSFQVTSHEGNREVIPKMSRRNRVITGHNFRRRRTKTAVKSKEGEKGGRSQKTKEKGRGCKKHQEPFKLFCKDHEALICVVCDKSKEHENHKVIPLDEASEAYKARIWNLLETLKKERENILAYKAETEQESQSLLTQTKTEKGKTLVAFRQMHQFLEEQEKLLLVQMEEVEKEISAKREDHLARLSEELSSLEGLIREMEEKHRQPASELLQDIGSFLQGCEKKEKFENPVAFPPALKWKIWDFCDINPFLEGVMKQFKDTLESGLQQKKAKVTLDPKTAHPHLILSEDHRTVTCGENLQDLPDNPERFNLYPYVLGCEGFPGGRHFWEVTVRSEGVWAVGVARKSASRKGSILYAPTAGIWEMGKWENAYKAYDLCDPYSYLVLPLREEPKRIRVTVNCEGDRLAFYNADTAALIFEYLSVGFSEETLLPSFYVQRKGHLMISP